MHYKPLSILALSTAVMAAEPAQRRQMEDIVPTDIDIPSITVPDVSNMMTDIDFGNIPEATLLPESVRSSMTDPAYASAILSSVANDDSPDWVSDLPDDVQSSFSSAASKLQTVIPTISAMPTSGGGSTGGAGGGSTASGGGQETGGATDSTGGAPRPTGAVAAGFAGAAGVLGLAVAL